MRRNVFINLLVLGWTISSVPAQEAKTSVAEIVANLRKGDSEKLKPLQELEALGEKAEEAASAVVDLLPDKEGFPGTAERAAVDTQQGIGSQAGLLMWRQVSSVS